jgi:hypothetical protein
MFGRKTRTDTASIVARELKAADKAAKQADKAMAELDKALGLGTLQADVLASYSVQRFSITDAQLSRKGY